MENSVTITITPPQRDSLKRLYEYLCEAEEPHFAESGEPDDHIFRDVQVLEDLLSIERGESEVRCKHGVILNFDDCFVCDNGED